ncbi:MAG: hypothetical protein VW362_02930 [Candidatus Nanopelagicales bacterium]
MPLVPTSAWLTHALTGPPLPAAGAISVSGALTAGDALTSDAASITTAAPLADRAANRE